MLNSLPLYLNGVWVTVQITVAGAALALALSFAAGLLGSARRRWIRAIGRVYTEFFRGVAALVLMYWLFYALPYVGFRLDPMFAAILALGLNVGAYGGEVVRGAVNAVPRAQIEATTALNMGYVQRMRLVVIPQAWAAMLPPMGNLLIELMKGSAVVGLITVSDLTFVVRQQWSSGGDTLVVWGLALLFYFLIAQALLLGVRYLERRANARLGRGPAFRAAPEPAAASAGGSGR
ncbi:ectoine/hydroxyectoine ABC transporter permease subunit EhuC [Allonocardiopsis opalescens]|uniref:Amino acid ABC transporter membrane protein 1 (PAAT family) n=1 Tax=Allonocardiopsis opalescens TaxID=1144618 RepID=A0A2T0Q9H7_9ACTN|nr:ectoine/hydroxyectoine ABC transporter permease subunit EhuC [Allonocardiopsis opalescens]PRY00546.1 amino acid ABC transporter membrane protein 1 (PAAT family) [Allonocardiopsis opalescens]